MGLFGKKKNPGTFDSVLTESEIHKKLYGEFESSAAHVVSGEREHFKEPPPLPVLPRESKSEREPVLDFFPEAQGDLVDPDLPPKQNFTEQKPAEQAPRYVPLHDFEKRSASPAAPVSGADPHTRFRYNRPSVNKMDTLRDLGSGVWGKSSALAKALMDPKQVVLRRFVYWGAAILAVFLLFWGVNSLNSQREDAMRARYKMPVNVAAAEAPAAVVPAPVVEREVTITPAPVRVKKAAASTAAASTAYVIQVVTYPGKHDAEQIVEALKQAGLRAFVQENARPSGRVFYLVLIGGFRTAAEAQAQLLKFRSLEVARPFQDSFVRTNRS
jgi:cell division septation protein DedD